jgi:hypothetical protein
LKTNHLATLTQSQISSIGLSQAPKWLSFRIVF